MRADSTTKRKMYLSNKEDIDLFSCYLILSKMPQLGDILLILSLVVLLYTYDYNRIPQTVYRVNLDLG